MHVCMHEMCSHQFICALIIHAYVACVQKIENQTATLLSFKAALLWLLHKHWLLPHLPS